MALLIIKLGVRLEIVFLLVLESSYIVHRRRIRRSGRGTSLRRQPCKRFIPKSRFASPDRELGLDRPIAIAEPIAFARISQ